MVIYLTTEELASRIKYEARYIREKMKDRVFKKGIHYIKPFNGRRILFIWNEIEKIMNTKEEEQNPMIKIPLRRNR